MSALMTAAPTHTQLLDDVQMNLVWPQERHSIIVPEATDAVAATITQQTFCFLQAMESKLLVGGKNIIDHTNEQQKMLEVKRHEIAEQVNQCVFIDIRHIVLMWQ